LGKLPGRIEFLRCPNYPFWRNDPHTALPPGWTLRKAQVFSIRFLYADSIFEFHEIALDMSLRVWINE
jgi:hypothetical protein